MRFAKRDELKYLFYCQLKVPIDTLFLNICDTRNHVPRVECISIFGILFTFFY